MQRHYIASRFKSGAADRRRDYSVVRSVSCIMHQDFITCPPQFVIAFASALSSAQEGTIAPLSFVHWIMEQVSAALTATVSFLVKNKNLDMAAYAAIESTQVQQLLGQLTEVSLTLDEATRLSESIHASGLNAKHKAALHVALSGSSGNTPPRGRACQKLLSGFFNYLTKTDRALLSNERQHAFARASVVVDRMLSIGLYMPCEKTVGRITQTCAERFSMGGSPQEKHALLEELKRQLKGQREGLQPKVFDSRGSSIVPSVLRRLLKAMSLCLWKQLRTSPESG